MAEITFWLDNVTHALLKLFGARKTAITLSFPDEFVIDPDFKIATRAGDECNFSKRIGKGGEQLLRHPCCAQQPVALGAVEYRYAWLVLHG